MKINERIKRIISIANFLCVLKKFFRRFVRFLKETIKAPILLTTYYKWNLHKVRVQDLSKQ